MARQGEPCQWPSWDDEVGSTIKSRLARVEIDPLIEGLRESMWTSYTGLFTNTGKAKAHGRLEQLENLREKLGTELRDIDQQKQEVEELQRRFSMIGPRVEGLRREAAAREKEALDLRELAAKAEQLLKEVENRKTEFEHARERLTTVAEDVDGLAKLDAELVKAREAAVRAATAAEQAAAKEVEARGKVAAAEESAEWVNARLKQLRERSERIEGLLKLRRISDGREAVGKVLKKAEAQTAALRELRGKLDQVPNVTPAKLARLRELHSTIRECETKLAAAGLALELTPDTATNIVVVRDGKEENVAIEAGDSKALRAPRSIELRLPGWGRLCIRSGAAELQELLAELEAAQTKLREQLAAADCATLDDAEHAEARRRDLQRELKVAEVKLEETLEEFGSVEELQSQAAALDRQLTTLREAILPEETDLRLATAELEADAEQVGTALKNEQKSQNEFDRELKRLRTEAAAATEARNQAEQEGLRARNAVATIQEKQAALRGRYPQGIDAARAAAQQAFTECEARLATATAKLPPDAEKLPDRNRRAAAASQEVRNEVEKCQREHDQLEGALQSRGAAGLYSKESALLEQLEAVEREIEQLRVRGWAARLAHDLIEFRKQAATRTVLGPIESRLSTAFAEISRDGERQVFLDEQLQISGIGARRDAVIAFENLSQGAKEQLLLCLRIAVAREVVGTGHQLVVLDDVLVNTDPQRQHRVLDLLQSAAEQLQILILTCHPEHYRGIGEVASIRTDLT